MNFFKRTMAVFVILILLGSNLYFAALVVRERSIRNDFASSSSCWASIAGRCQAELDYMHGIDEIKEYPIEPEVISSDVQAVIFYIGSYNRKLSKLKNTPATDNLGESDQ
jgi:hypothetical protein